MCLHCFLSSVECVLGPKYTMFYNLRSEKVNVRQWGVTNTEPCGPCHSEVPQGSRAEGSRGPSCGPGLPCIWQGVDAWGQTSSVCSLPEPGLLTCFTSGACLPAFRVHWNFSRRWGLRPLTLFFCLFLFWVVCDFVILSEHPVFSKCLNLYLSVVEMNHAKQCGILNQFSGAWVLALQRSHGKVLDKTSLSYMQNAPWLMRQSGRFPWILWGKATYNSSDALSFRNTHIT